MLFLSNYKNKLCDFRAQGENEEIQYFPDSQTLNTQLVLSFICKYFMLICTPACTNG